MVDSNLTGMELWRYLADELKLPLVQIARTAELAETDQPAEQLRIIETTASNALRLIDGYLLVSGLAKQQQLDLAPVSVTATLYDVAQDLYEMSRLYDTRIDIRVKGSTGQAMAHGPALKVALTSLAYTFLTGGLKGRQQSITLLAEQTSRGVTAGVLSSSSQVTTEDLTLARELYGRAGQPAGGLTQNSGLGLYVADHLFTAMEAPLRAIKSSRKTGIAATMAASRQLALL